MSNTSAKQRHALEEYEGALGASSWENLQEAYPVIAERLETAVDVGVSPAQIHQSTLKSGHSPRLAKWCRAAAEHLVGFKES